MNRTYHDDNFGAYEGMDGPDAEDNLEFYKQNQRRSVSKKCVDCGRKVRILPEYECCSPCADRREGGGY